MKKEKHLFIIAGEHSGDHHGQTLMQAFKTLGKVKFSGIGGPRMRQEGLQTFLKMENFTLMGFKEIFCSFFKVAHQFRKTRKKILKTKPDAVIFVDYPGFNIRMATSLRKKGYRGKLIHYISPSVWAWGKKRIKKMAHSLDILLAILPFEAKCYEETTLPVTYVGHPTVEQIENYNYDPLWREKLGIEPNKKILSLFPGSRTLELERGFPKQLDALQQIDGDYLLAISCADEKHREKIQQEIYERQLPAYIIPAKFTYELMKESVAAIATSGTITLELALHQIPTVVTYEVKGFNRFVAKYIIRLNLPFYCIVNIIGNREIFPEYIATKYTSALLAEQLNHLISQPENSLSGCREIKQILGTSTASKNAAKHIWELLS